MIMLCSVEDKYPDLSYSVYVAHARQALQL